MPYFHIQSFQSGLDGRKSPLAGVPGSLIRASNLHLDRGGQLEKRRALEFSGALPPDTTGLFADNNRTWTFGIVAESALSRPLPAGVEYIKMTHPTDPSVPLRRILSAAAFDGKVYSIGLYDDGSIQHFYDGAYIQGISEKMAAGSSIRNAEQLASFFDQSIRNRPSAIATSAKPSARVVRLTGTQDGTFTATTSNRGGAVGRPAPVVSISEVQAGRVADPNAPPVIGSSQTVMWQISPQAWGLNVLDSYAWTLTIDIPQSFIPAHDDQWDLQVNASFSNTFYDSSTGAPDQYARISLVGFGEGDAWPGGSGADYAAWLAGQINAGKSSALWVRNGLSSGPLTDRVDYSAVSRTSLNPSDPHYVHISWQPLDRWLTPQFPGSIQYLFSGGLTMVTPIGRAFGYPGSPAPWLPPQGVTGQPGNMLVRFTSLGRFQRILAINSTWQGINAPAVARNFLLNAIDVPDPSEFATLAEAWNEFADRVQAAMRWGGITQVVQTGPDAYRLDATFYFPPLGSAEQPRVLWRGSVDSVFLNVSNPDLVATWRGLSGRPQITDLTFPADYDDRDIYRVLLARGSSSERYEKIGFSGGSAASEAGIGTFALTHKRKIHVTHKSILYFSALNNPAVWDPESTQFPGAGFINMANQTKGSQRLTGLAPYNGRLAVFSEDAIQVWQVDENDENSRLEQTINGIGTRYPASIQPFGSSEVLFLSDQGVRSLASRAQYDSAFVTDVGMPVDDIVRRALREATADDLNAICSCVEPMDGRYWLAIGREVFVMSYFPQAKVVGWTTYRIDEISDGERIEYLWSSGRRVFARAGDELFIYDQVNGRFNRVPVAAVAVFQDNGKPAHRKKFYGLDMTLETGNAPPVVAMAFYSPDAVPPVEGRQRLNDPLRYPGAGGSSGNATYGIAETIADVTTRTIYDAGRIPLVGRGHHIAVAFTQGFRDPEMPPPPATWDRTDITMDQSEPTFDATVFGVPMVRVANVREDGQPFRLAEVMVHYNVEDDK